MQKVQDIVSGWEINNTSEFGDTLKPQYTQLLSKLEIQTLNCRIGQKIKQTEYIRERKLNVNNSYLGQKNLRQKKENKLKPYPIQQIMLEQQNLQFNMFQEQPVIFQRVKPSTSLNCVLRRKNIYLQSILKQVNQFESLNKNTKSRSCSVRSVNQSPRWFCSTNIQNNKYI